MTEQVNFEEALQQLEKAVELLESGDLPLDQALKVFTGGVEQARICRKTLADIELQVEQLLRREDGDLESAEFDHD